MSQASEKPVNTVYQDLYMHSHVFGEEFQPDTRYDADTNLMLQGVFESTIVATTDVGVVVGKGARAYAEQVATEHGLEQDLVEPLYAKAPFPFEGEGELKVIPRKIGEPRGMYFARVVMAVDEEVDSKRAASLFNSLAMQLLLEVA